MVSTPRSGRESRRTGCHGVVGTSRFYTVRPVEFDPDRDYPLGSRRPDLVDTPGGVRLEELSLARDELGSAELRATPATLRLQAEVARASGRPQLADNLLRASELAALSEDTILEIYGALRPRRSTAAELDAWAARLDDLGAPVTARFVRDAAEVYARRGFVAG